MQLVQFLLVLVNLWGKNKKTCLNLGTCHLWIHNLPWAYTVVLHVKYDDKMRIFLYHCFSEKLYNQTYVWTSKPLSIEWQKTFFSRKTWKYCPGLQNHLPYIGLIFYKKKNGNFYGMLQLLNGTFHSPRKLVANVKINHTLKKWKQEVSIN